MTKDGFHYKAIKDLSQFVRESTKPVIFGVGGDDFVGYPTDFKQLASEISDPNYVYECHGPLYEDPIESLSSNYSKVSMSAFDRILEFDADDQVVKVGSDIFLQANPNRPECGDLASELSRRGQCLPLSQPERNPESMLPYSDALKVGRGIALNAPHFLQSQCGSWRDWVLGMTLVLADGKVVKVGSKAVKNVAGFDIQKLIVGSYDSLAIVVDVTLRTYPIGALPKPQIIRGPASLTAIHETESLYEWCQRVQRSDFQEACKGAGDQLAYADIASCTLWCRLESADAELHRYPGDWVVRAGCGKKNLEIVDETQIRLMKKAKQILDPTNKLNPGEWGFM